jgi:hypothetical protein
MKHILSAATVALLAWASPALATVNAQTGTTYTFANTDCDQTGRTIVTFSNAAATAVTLPQAGGSGNFLACQIVAENVGLGVVTITPTTSTINGQASLVLSAGASVSIYNDAAVTGTGNYWATSGSAGQNGVSPENFRNVVQNGDMVIQQRGTGERTGGTTTIPNTAYSADRWGCNANVTSGQAFCAALTATPPTGARGSQSVYRKANALTQPVCMMQEIPTADFTPLGGQVVTLSFTAKALAGMIADNGGVMNAYIFTGTGADQGLQSFTASPAITPAWTGISSTLTKAVTLTTTYQRFSYTATIPSAATEGGVAFCFTPTATGAGVTDGFNFSLVQLEVGPFPTPYEIRPQTVEYAMDVQRYMRVTESATSAVVEGTCVSSTTSISNCFVKFPMAMVKVPTMSYTTGFLASAQSASTSGFACTGLTTSATTSNLGPSTTGVLIDCASSAAGPAAGTSGFMWDAGTGTPGGLIEAFADF